MIPSSELEFASISNQIGEALLSRKLMLATAESCTGGWVAQVVTMTPGSSNWFDRGFVTYSNQAKQEMLGVQQDTLAKWGAVSEQTVAEMAQGALKHSHAQVSVAITGIAGPDGGSAEKPVGLVWLGWQVLDQKTITEKFILSGDRWDVRAQAVKLSLTKLAWILQLITR